ncbi:unnamed protein product [Bathycoccus prasinos]
MSHTRRDTTASNERRGTEKDRRNFDELFCPPLFAVFVALLSEFSSNISVSPKRKAAEMMMATTTFTSSLSSPSIRSSSGAKTSISSSFNSTTTTSKKSSTTFSRRIRANLGPELKTQIDKCVTENKVVLFMKGTKSAPKCGFSNTCVQILQSMNVPFTDVDILASEQLRVGMKTYSSWPTFPQLYIGGEFFGGCDITMDAYKDGSLKEELERAMLE